MRKYREKIDRYLKKCIVSSRRKGTVRSIIVDLSYDDKTWRAQYLDGDNSVSATKIFFEGCHVVPGFPVDGHIYSYNFVSKKLSSKVTNEGDYK